MSSSRDLTKAKIFKNDEFYTLFSDIEEEVSHYVEQFKDKVVYCNCDDPKYSNFWKYFHLNFEKLGLKKLICTYYNSDYLYTDEPVYAKIYLGSNDSDISVGEQIPLKRSGDFRSAECIEYLKECDICCTNPPFSLFKEYVAQLLEYNKKFLIVGDAVAVAYNDIFPLFISGDISMGYRPMNKTMLFDTTKDYKKFLLENNKNGNGYLIKNGVLFARVNGCWFTNMDIDKKILFLPKEKYDSHKYPHYDNYDAINIGRVEDIPYDYLGVMGVPITYMDKHNSNLFEIVGMLRHGTDSEWDFGKPILNGKVLFTRVLIKKKNNL